jgi:hypothetical protein
MAKAWWEPCKERVHSGIVVPYFATKFVKEYEAEGRSDEDSALVTFGLMLAGAWTTGATINFFFMSCCKFLETMKEAQAELDRVVGDKRYPTMEDEPNLPYVRAMLKENNRWRPILNQGQSTHSLEGKPGLTYRHIRCPSTQPQGTISIRVHNPERHHCRR